MTNFSEPYVTALSDCTYDLVQYLCTQDGYGYGCPYYDPTADIQAQCAVANSSAQADLLYAANNDPCSVLQPPDWSIGLHVAAVFVVLIASSMGAGIPILAKYHPGFALDPYWIMLGKCMGIGVVLACALVHMLQPSNESLTSPCLPWEFNTDYTYAYLYCVLAVLAMHFIDFIMEAYLLKRWTENLPASARQHMHRDEIAMVTIGEANTAVASIKIPAEMPTTVDDGKPDHEAEKKAADMPEPQTAPASPASAGLSSPSASSSVYKHLSSPTNKIGATSSTLDLQTLDKGMEQLPHAALHSGHVHSVLLIAGMKRTISAYMLEFGVTVHSVFIGLANGIDGDTQLHVLLVALVFHQMFEGIALGSRIADANMPSHWHEVLLTLVFSLAAPLGIAIGIAVKTGLNPNGETFLMVQGTFDGVCSGILLYIGLVLLLRDFPEDMQRYCKGSHWRMFGMFAALYLGAGLMSFIGKYL